MIEQATAALAAWSLEGAELVPITVGLINVTYEVRADERFVLQRLNPIFSPGVHEDIEAVTAHLAKKGLETPTLVRTTSGERWTTIGDGVWRMLSWVEGDTHVRLRDPKLAREAGALLGRFHRATSDLEHEFVNRRLGVHDTPKHMRALEAALTRHRDHRNYDRVARMAETILRRCEALGALPAVADRIVHGDPKISNVIFGEGGRAKCFVDLDTLAKMPVYLELGDALRSWCNPAGEDADAATFSPELFEAAVTGYAQGAAGLLEADEVSALVPATSTILLELAARFAADALDESYFGFDPVRFATRGDHNLLRAERQLEEATALDAQRAIVEGLVRRAFA